MEDELNELADSILNGDIDECDVGTTSQRDSTEYLDTLRIKTKDGKTYMIALEWYQCYTLNKDR